MPRVVAATIESVAPLPANVVSFNAVKPLQIAVLIDADNIPPRAIPFVLADLATRGSIVSIRLYGDFSLAHNATWKSVAQEYAMKVVHHFENLPGKNATDLVMVMDGMELLYSRDPHYDAFGIVSSDSDFTAITMRYRQAGRLTFNYGMVNTSRVLRLASQCFVEIETLMRDAVSVKTPEELPSAGMRPLAPQLPQKPLPIKPAAVAAPKPAQAASKAKPKAPPTLVKAAAAKKVPGPVDHPLLPVLKAAMSRGKHNQGWYTLNQLGNSLHVVQPGFNVRAYGASSLSKLVQKHQSFLNLQTREPSPGKPKALHVQLREAA